MPREIEPVGRDEHGDETHPAFGMIQANRVSQGPTGAALFDSDVRHNHYVTLKISRASRRRDLHRDWISSGREVIEVAMSEAQWAGMISSMNTSGTPCTLRWLAGEGMLPDLDFDSRLQLSHREVAETAQRSMDRINEAMAAYAEKKSAANLRALQVAIEHLPANMEFAAKSLSEHAETVVQKSRADIEAMMMHAAEQAGVAPPRYTPLEGTEDGAPKELEK